MGLETARRGISTVEGVCSYCGLVKRYPAFRGNKKSRRAKSATTIPPKIDVSGLAPVRAAEHHRLDHGIRRRLSRRCWTGICSRSDRNSDGSEQPFRGRI